MPENKVVKKAGETYGEIVQRLSDTNTSNRADNTHMQAMLKKLGFPNAIVTSGIVYMEGRGTLESPPLSINSVACYILETLDGRK